MPRVDAIIDCLGNAHFFKTKMDLAKGFHQVTLRPKDSLKAAFCTPWGKFQYCFMPFGQCNAPATFQRLMDIVLHDIWVYCRAYIDDVVVYSFIVVRSLCASCKCYVETPGCWPNCKEVQV